MIRYAAATRSPLSADRQHLCQNSSIFWNKYTSTQTYKHTNTITNTQIKTRSPLSADHQHPCQNYCTVWYKYTNTNIQIHKHTNTNQVTTLSWKLEDAFSREGDSIPVIFLRLVLRIHWHSVQQFSDSLAVFCICCASVKARLRLQNSAQKYFWAARASGLPKFTRCTCNASVYGQSGLLLGLL